MYKGYKHWNIDHSKTGDFKELGVPLDLQVVAHSRFQHLFKGIINPPTHPTVEVEHLDPKTDFLIREILTLYWEKRRNSKKHRCDLIR